MLCYVLLKMLFLLFYSQRSESQYSLEDHGGSRKRLMFSRRQGMREDCQSRMDAAQSLKTTTNTRRLKLITNIEAENS